MYEEMDEIALFYPGDSFFERWMRHFARLRMVYELHPKTAQYLRSQAVISHEIYYHLRSNTYMIHPFSEFRMWWDFVMIGIYIVLFFLVPILPVYLKGSNIETPSLVFQTGCLVDILLNFFTGYYDTGSNKVIMEPKYVARRYMKTFFFFDFVSTVPFYKYRVYDKTWHPDLKFSVVLITRLMPLCKIIRITTVTSNINVLIKFCGKWPVFIKSCRGVIFALLYIHWMTCVIEYVTELRMYRLDGWEKVRVVGDTDIINIFFHDYSNDFFNMTCLATGAALLIPHNLDVASQVIYAIIIISAKFFTVCLIAWISMLRSGETSPRSNYQAMVQQLRDYMNHKHLPHGIQNNLLGYYEFRFQRSYFRENEIFSTISTQLRHDIIMHSCRKLVENVTFFKGIPTPLLIKIVSCLKSTVYLPNDVVIRVNTIGDSMFFIATGTVAVYSSSGKEICHLEDGYHFGEISLVMPDQKRSASVVAVEICELYRFDRTDFMKSIRPYPDLLRNIETIGTERLEMTIYLDEKKKRMSSERIKNIESMS